MNIKHNYSNLVSQSYLLFTHNKIDWTFKESYYTPNLIHLEIFDNMSIDDPDFQIFLKSDNPHNPEFIKAKSKFILETIEDIKRLF
jgi:hypothetical protein